MSDAFQPTVVVHPTAALPSSLLSTPLRALLSALCLFNSLTWSCSCLLSSIDFCSLVRSIACNRTKTKIACAGQTTQHDMSIGFYREIAIAIQDESGDSNGVMCSTSQCELRSTFPNLRVTNVIRIVTFYTLPPLESPTSSWMTRSQRSRRRDKGLLNTIKNENKVITKQRR